MSRGFKYAVWSGTAVSMECWAEQGGCGQSAVLAFASFVFDVDPLDRVAAGEMKTAVAQNVGCAARSER